MFNSLEKESTSKSKAANFYMFDAWDFDREEPYNHLVSRTRDNSEYDKYFRMLKEVSDDNEITHARIIDYKTGNITYYDSKLNIITLEEWTVLQNRHKIHFILGNS